tara:strand:- start:156 stop:422 length:267 start_codon:yes stop_codon:yes gene_type:complete
MGRARISWLLPVWAALKFPEKLVYTSEFVVFLQGDAILLQRVFGLGITYFRTCLQLGCLIGKYGDVEVTLKHYRPIGCYLEWGEIAYE